jgi:hypothetical protein
VYILCEILAFLIILLVFLWHNFVFTCYNASYTYASFQAKKFVISNILGNSFVVVREHNTQLHHCTYGKFIFRITTFLQSYKWPDSIRLQCILISIFSAFGLLHIRISKECWMLQHCECEEINQPVLYYNPIWDFCFQICFIKLFRGQLQRFDNHWTYRSNERLFLVPLPLILVCDVDAGNGAVDDNAGPNDAMRKFVRSDVRLGRGGGM